MSTPGHDGKVIVYGGSVERVKRLGEMFGCGTYYNKVDTIDGKKERLQTWMMGERIMVATNALGMGIDIPDVRLVVHAWMPRRIRDYVQESGRAGRDGHVSDAVIICRGLKQDKEEVNRREKAKAEKSGWIREKREERSVEYVEREECRRKILDMAMDGRIDRESCEEGEERCDICRRMEEVSVEGAVGEDEEEEEDEGGYAEARMAFDRQRRDIAFQEWQNKKQIMEEAAMASELEEYLESWAECCVICRMGDEADEHRIEDCPLKKNVGYKEVVGFKTRIEENMFRVGGFEKYSGCFGCGLPYQVCKGWKVMDDDGGKYEKVRGVPCQYKGLLACFYGAACCIFKDEVVGLSGQEVGSKGFFQWAGRRIPLWGGMETNEMCRGFIS
jgi:hypothetical protein